MQAIRVHNNLLNIITMKIFLFASIIFLFDGFAASSQLNNRDSTKGLKDYYHDYFTVGVSLFKDRISIPLGVFWEFKCYEYNTTASSSCPAPIGHLIINQPN
jgi:hypothetical protein